MKRNWSPLFYAHVLIHLDSNAPSNAPNAPSVCTQGSICIAILAIFVNVDFKINENGLAIFPPTLVQPHLGEEGGGNDIQSCRLISTPLNCKHCNRFQYYNFTKAGRGGRVVSGILQLPYVVKLPIFHPPPLHLSHLQNVRFSLRGKLVTVTVQR